MLSLKWGSSPVDTIVLQQCTHTTLFGTTRDIDIEKADVPRIWVYESENFKEIMRI
jgi:hypothetical protein